MIASAQGIVHFLVKGPQGENGSSGASYWIVTSQSSLTRGVNGTLTPSTVSAVRMKSVDKSTPQQTTDYFLVYCDFNSSGTLLKRTRINNGQFITPSSNAAYITFYMLLSATAELSTAIATAGVSIVNDGENGVGSYAMDMDNENINIGLVTRNGSLYPVANYNSGSSGIYVAAGASNVATINKMELLSSAGNVLATATTTQNASWSSTELGISSLTLSLNEISVVFDTNIAHSSGERIELKLRGTLSVTDGNGTRSVEVYKVWTILFQPPGADGISPTVYELQPSDACVVIDPNNDYARTPSTVTCKVVKHSGNSYSNVTNKLAQEGLRLLAVIDGVENETTSQNVSYAENLEWVLKKGATPIDREVIAFVNGGQDGVDGKSPVLLRFNPSALVFNKDVLPIGYVNVFIERGDIVENPKSLSLATEVANLNVVQETHSDGSKALRLSPLTGFSYNGNIAIVVVDENDVAYLGSINVSTTENGQKGDKGDDSITPFVAPSYLNYTVGKEKIVQMSLYLMEGASQKAPTSISVKFNSSTTNSYGGIIWNSSAKTLTISPTATFGSNPSDVITFTLTYRGKTFPVSIPVSRTLNGSPGPAGLIYRKTEWHENTEYSNDEALLGQQDFCYLDIVYIMGTNGKIKGVYECLVSHTSSPENSPLAETFDINEMSEHWRKINLMKPIYTSLLLAEGSVIGFMQGNQLKIYDLDGNLKAGISAATGDYPIFYANPQKYPVRVQTYYAVTTSTISGHNAAWKDNDSVSSSNTLTIPKNNYLQLKFVCFWSDGSSGEFYKTNVQNTSSQLQTTSPMVIKFCNTRENSVDEANTSVVKTSPNTSAAKPYLWIGAQLGSKFFGWYQIATQTAGVEDSTRAMYQVKESGDVIMGMPTGARIQMIAAPTDGLPRMDVYDEDGNQAAIFDGSQIGNAAELYGDGTASADLSGALSVNSESSPLTPSEDTFVDVSTEKRTTIDVEKDSALVVSAFSLTLNASFFNGEKASNDQYVIASLYIDSHLAQQAILHKSEGSTKTFYFAQYNWTLSRGRHNLVLRLSYRGQYGDGTPSASCIINNNTSAIIFTASYGKLMCRYFANGIAIGSATNNYFMVWNDSNGFMNFIMENKGVHGLKVTSDGVYIKRPSNPADNDKWVLL